MDFTYATANDYPLRILVPSDAVGAIIGKQGSTIKQIKQATHAKVDVNRSESANSQERVIVIRGQLDNCTQACREILRIMYEDAKTKNKTQEIVLKVLAHNNFIGRIIGKAGNIINALKKDTETNITVSSINELNTYNSERIISIKGELDQQIRALELIYSKLCLANETDNARAWNAYSSLSYQQAPHPQQQQQQQQQQQLMHHYAQQAAAMNAAAVAAPPLLPTHYGPQQQQASLMSHASLATTNGSSSKYIEQPVQQASAQQATQPTAIYHPSYYPSMYPAPGQFYVPYTSSGPLLPAHAHPYGNLLANGNGTYSHPPLQPLAPSQSLGTSQIAPTIIETVHLYVPNTAIGAIIGTKGLFIKSIIKNSNASVKINSIGANEDQNKVLERQITISGTPEAQWKSQYYIYDKIRQEGYAGDDEVRLRAEINVPTTLIGRLVGKGGQNVRQLQQSTGAVIKLPEDSQQTSASEVPVKIIGSFQASQFAQRRIQSIIQMSRESTIVTNEDSNQNNGEQSNHIVTNSTSSNNLNETQTIVNGSTVSDDAVVASSTLRNTDDSIPAVVDQKSSDE